MEAIEIGATWLGVEANDRPWECSDVYPLHALVYVAGVVRVRHLASSRTTVWHLASPPNQRARTLCTSEVGCLNILSALSTAHLSIDTMFRTALQTVRPQARAFSASALRAAGSVTYNDVKPLTKQPTDVSGPRSVWAGRGTSGSDRLHCPLDFRPAFLGPRQDVWIASSACLDSLVWIVPRLSRVDGRLIDQL